MIYQQVGEIPYCKVGTERGKAFPEKPPSRTVRIGRYTGVCLRYVVAQVNIWEYK